MCQDSLELTWTFIGDATDSVLKPFFWNYTYQKGKGTIFDENYWAIIWPRSSCLACLCQRTYLSSEWYIKMRSLYHINLSKATLKSCFYIFLQNINKNVTFWPFTQIGSTLDIIFTARYVWHPYMSLRKLCQTYWSLLICYIRVPNLSVLQWENRQNVQS